MGNTRELETLLIGALPPCSVLKTGFCYKTIGKKAFYAFELMRLFFEQMDTQNVFFLN